jgi:hypothetical protein
MRTKRSSWSSFAALLFVAAGCTGKLDEDQQRSNLGGVTYGGVTYGGDGDGGGSGSDGGSGPDGSTVDAADADVDAPDADVDACDADVDAPDDADVDAPDDADVDADVDAPDRDAGIDASIDAPVDAPPDGPCVPQYDPEPTRPPEPPSLKPGPEPSGCYNICDLIDSGWISSSEVSQPTLDECNGVPPSPTMCFFSPYPDFFVGTNGCSVSHMMYGYLGDFRYDCPSDPYQQQILCDYAVSTLFPLPPLLDPVAWWPGEGSSPPPSNTSDEYTNPNPGGANRNLVVIGSSMLSTHNQVNNGPQCTPFDINGRVLTAMDDRRLKGSDFTASPAWLTRVPWLRVFRGARTGHTSGQVRNGTNNPATNDGCGQNWNQAVSPMQAGVDWLANKDNRLMITDGGLINDEKNVDGDNWPATLSGVVVCQALDEITPAINTLLDWDHWVMNWARAGWFEGRPPRWVRRQAPTVRLQRSTPGGKWKDALDEPANAVRPRCQYVVQVAGNGRMPASLAAVLRIGYNVSPLVRLWKNGPAGSPVPGNLTAIKDKYLGPPFVSKQIWLQYPYMDQAQVQIRGSDVGLFWPGGGANVIVQALGRQLTYTINAIDPGLRPRIKQVTDDLNELMFLRIGCPAANWAANHGPLVCARDAAMKPTVVVTRADYPGWGAADHQNTIKGGMPHESAAGANKLGAALVVADGLQ